MLAFDFTPLLDGFIPTIGLALAAAVVKFVIDRREAKKVETKDEIDSTEFLWGPPGNPRLGIPRGKGWVHKVDARIEQLALAQGELSLAQGRMQDTLDEVLYELKPNGGGNFRGRVERAIPPEETP